MARERTPEGKRVVIPVRVSEPKAAAIDAARGDTPRSVWVEAAIDTALERQRPPAAAPRQRKTGPAACPHRLPSGAYCKTCEQSKP